MTVAEKVKEYQAHTTGSGEFYKHWAKRLIYTEGVHFLAETAGAHWLIDIVASYQSEAALRKEDFQVWTLQAPVKSVWKDEKAPWAAECWTDTPESKGSKRLVRQEFEYSDFPAELCPFKLFACRNETGGVTLMLPEEY